MVKQQRREELIQTISRRLRDAREATGLSQEKVLFHTGIYLTSIENGHRNITVSTLITLCNTYGITLRDFFKTIKENGEAQPE